MTSWTHSADTNLKVDPVNSLNFRNAAEMGQRTFATVGADPGNVTYALLFDYSLAENLQHVTFEGLNPEHKGDIFEWLLGMESLQITIYANAAVGTETSTGLIGFKRWLSAFARHNWDHMLAWDRDRKKEEAEAKAAKVQNNTQIIYEEDEEE